MRMGEELAEIWKEEKIKNNSFRLETGKARPLWVKMPGSVKDSSILGKVN